MFNPQILTFYGHLQARVLGGVVLVNSYALKPCDGYLTMCAPQDSCNSAISMEVMDPLLNVSTVVIHAEIINESTKFIKFFHSQVFYVSWCFICLKPCLQLHESSNLPVWTSPTRIVNPG